MEVSYLFPRRTVRRGLIVVVRAILHPVEQVPKSPVFQRVLDFQSETKAIIRMMPRILVVIAVLARILTFFTGYGLRSLEPDVFQLPRPARGSWGWESRCALFHATFVDAHAYH